jgi:hypothetical protein
MTNLTLGPFQPVTVRKKEEKKSNAPYPFSRRD